MTRSHLSLEHYAVALAHVAHFETEGMTRVLEQLGLEPSVWEDTTDHWLGLLQDEFDDELAPVATGFGAAFSRAKAKLQLDKPALEHVSPLVEAPKIGADFSPVDITAPGGVPALAEEVLPFIDAPGGAAPPPLAPVPLDGSAGDVGETQFVLAIDIPEHVLPFSEPATLLTIVQYASLQVELTRWPAKKAAILARYGVVGDEAHDLLDAAWAKRLAADPAERARFEELVATYTQWLESQSESAGGSHETKV